MMRKTALLVSAAFASMVFLLRADEPKAPDKIACEGEYPWHLQGVATDGTFIYWSFTDRIVKTDETGRRLCTSPVQKMHLGDLCVAGGVVYAAFNGGAFNEETGADSWVYGFRADDMKPLKTWKVPEVVHGAGGIAYKDGLFYVVGGLPKTHVKNYLYVYTPQFKFVKRIDVASGYTMLGIQAIDFIRGDCLLGVYPKKGSPTCLIRCPMDFSFCEELSIPGYCGMLEFRGRFYWTSAPEIGGDPKRQTAVLHAGTLPKLVKPRPPRAGNCIAWYRFEEGPAGSWTTAATTFANAANKAKHTARPYVHVPSGYGANLATEPVWLMPACVAGCAPRILDPVTGERFDNACALHFDVKDNEAQTDSPGGTVLVADDSAFHRQSMTVECFVRMAPVRDTRERLLFGQRSKGNSIFTWCVKYAGHVPCAQFSIPKATGGETRLSASGAQGLDDARWHHIAFTLDEEDGQIRFYQDYRCTQTVSFEGKICYDDPLPIMFGPCRKLNYSPIRHDIDEVRMTDCALVPEQFLKALPSAK